MIESAIINKNVLVQDGGNVDWRYSSHCPLGRCVLINQAYMFKFNLNTIRSYMRASMDVLYKLPEGPMALESFGEL